MLPKAVIQATMPIDLSGLLSAHCRVVTPPDQGSGLEAFSRAEFLSECTDAVAVVPLLSTTIDRELMLACPELRVVANYAVGYDNVDVAAATELGIFVCNTPGVLTEATADLAFALLLACARQVIPGHELVRAQKWRGWHPNLFLGQELFGKRLGIVGMGRIGQAMARRARGFGLEVVYHSRAEVAESRREGGIAVDFEDLLDTSDFISLHCPLTEETRELFDARAFSRMRPNAILINTARGGCVDEAALAAALAAGRLAGAGLDVFQGEPQVRAELLSVPGVVLAPHLGSATREARTTMATMCAEAIVTVLQGGVPELAVNRPQRPRG